MAVRPLDARRALVAHRKALGISIREAARQLHVSHVAYLKWESGDTVPSQPFRAAIEKWSGGEVPAIGWRLSPRERAQMARAARVGFASTGSDG